MLSTMKITPALVALFLAGAAGGREEFPPAEAVFRYAIESGEHCLTVYWNVAPGYYLYKTRLGLASGTSGVALGEPQYPKGEIHHDEYLGDQEIYRDDFTLTARWQRRTQDIQEMKVELKLQGCADAGLCYPPMVWEAKIKLPQVSATTVSPKS